MKSIEKFALSMVLGLAALLYLLDIGASSAADTIYKYKDENGVWRFTDHSPQTQQPVESYEAFTSLPKTKVLIKLHQEGNINILNIINEYYATVEVEVFLTDAENTQSDPALPERFEIPARSKQAVVRLQAKNKRAAWRYFYNYRYMIGPSDVSHRPPSPYLLPFKPGRSFLVSQAFNGEYSHQSDHSRYAVDISMPVGTPIVCTRDGTVVDVEQGYSWAGQNRDYYLNRINMVIILHDDGTMAYYGHLKRGSSRVTLGQKVTAGQVIAESGNTGFSSGPHLHFAIIKNQEMKMVAVPFTFLGSDGHGITPEAGMTLGQTSPKPAR